MQYVLFILIKKYIHLGQYNEKKNNNSAYCKEYRERLKQKNLKNQSQPEEYNVNENCKKTTARTNAQRCQEYRARNKQKKQV